MKTLEDYLLKHIPITKAMGIKVASASNEKIVLSAPFANNINHKKTVFGGSLNAVAILACWCLMHVNLPKGMQIVIASSEIAYPAPVAADFTAECEMPADSEWEQFLKVLAKKGRGRLKLKAQIVQEGRLCVAFTGVFVASAHANF
jgi:thioesterase domain-containing protein